MSGRLHAVRTDNPVTVHAAIAWCWPDGGSPNVIGFAFTPEAAPWWRLRDGTPLGPDEVCDLGRAYELVAFDGDRELRWLQDGPDTGHAVVLAEEGIELPAGKIADRWGPPASDTHLMVANPMIALGECHHLLADHVAPRSSGWARLLADRYQSADIPVDVTEPWENSAVTLDSIEYTTEDEHGNVGVVETRLTGLRVIPRSPSNQEVPR